MTTTGATYDHAAHTELFDLLKALEPDDRWVDVDPKPFWAATPSSPLKNLSLTEHSGHPILSLQKSQPVGIDFARDDIAAGALHLLVQLRSEIGEVIFAGLEPKFDSGVPQKAFVNLRSVRIRMGSAINNGRYTITAEAEYAVLAQQPKN